MATDMQRDLQSLAGRPYDVLVIGGGIYGAAIAREAALCGLSTALVEKRDFCSGTSANSLKIIHGGLRYLQQLDFIRLRSSVIERRAFLRTAPHLVHPLPCIMPTEGHGMKGREALFAGLLLNELLSADRNQLSDPEKHIPAGHLIPTSEVARLVPGLSTTGLTGGCAWHDAFTYNSERLVVAMVRDAVAAGARAANYTRATGFLQSDGRIEGVILRDELTGTRLEVRASLVINAAGPWVNEILAMTGRGLPDVVPALALGMNFVVRRPLLPECAAGLRSRRTADGPQRLLFMMPWRGCTLAGTYYRLHQGPADALAVTDEDIAILLTDLNHAYPAARITRQDIAAILPGLLPARHRELVNGEPVLATHYDLVDHATRDGTPGLLSVSGVKYTTARDVASRVLDKALACLDRPARRSGSLVRPLPGGRIPDFNRALREAQNSPLVPPETAAHLLRNYGDEMAQVLAYGTDQRDLLSPLGPDTHVIGAEVRHAIKREMAVTLDDIVLRRTDLGTAGKPCDATLEACADLAARDLGWTAEKRISEMEALVRSPLYGAS